MKKLTAAILIVVLGITALFAGACGKKAQEGPKLEKCPVTHETEFGGVYILNTIDEFNELGFEYGDSLNIEFSNGFTIEDIPYYNGYYTAVGEPLLVAYPGYPYIRAGINNGDDLWQIADLSEEDVADITLNERGKYLDIQKARDIHYKDERSVFPSDEAFANFRNVTVGNIKEGILYRSASPCDNQHKRAPYVDKLIEKAGVKYIVNLADTEEKIKGYIEKDDFDSPYFLSLYENGKVIPLAMNMNFGSDEFRGKLVTGLRSMLDNEGPYLFHCTEGKDRTGFMGLLIEALCGASYQEIVDDYMITYDNYYQINPEKDKERYELIIKHVLDPMVQALVGDPEADIKTADLSAAAESFLKASGMEEKEIKAFKDLMTK